jgi:hypothetical protein
VRALWEGREGGVVLYCVEVEDVRPLMVVRHRKPLVVGAYGRDSSRRSSHDLGKVPPSEVCFHT